MAEVQQDARANVGIMIYSVAITLGGAGLIVFTVLKDWGIMGYIGGGIFLVAGASMLVGRLRGGLTYVELTCPGCAHVQTFAEEALAKGRYVPCKSCDGYMSRDIGGGIQPVPEGTVDPDPIFEAACPEHGPRWPEGCTLCGEPATASETISGSTFHIGAVANKEITLTWEVPVCDQHQGQRAVELGSGLYIQGDKSFAVRFRSYRACLGFRELNPTDTRTTTGAAVTFGRQ